MVLWPHLALGKACSEFPWQHPPDMIMPELVQQGQEAIRHGSLVEGRELLTAYLSEHKEGVFAQGAKWMLASLPDQSDEKGKEFLAQIDRLQTMKTAHPDSQYVPWALCSMGQLYWDAEWYSEASGLFEEFLTKYPEDPLAGGVMVEAGLGYLKNQQYLEAALILRRVVEEPKWEAFRLQGALGLADATAMSKAWKQAYYWYRVVEAERPELIRESEHSSYYFGLTELAVGDPQKAISRFLTTANLHPDRKIAGHAFNRIAEKLLEDGHEFLSLWFAEQASLRFPDHETGRRGQATLTRWVIRFLSEEHSKEEWNDVYERLDDLEIYVSLSWDSVVETARTLSHAPEPDLVEESLMWLGRGYDQLGDRPAAIQTFKHLAIVANSKPRREEAQRQLGVILDAQLRNLYDRKAWVALLKFYEDQEEAFDLVPLNLERVQLVAQSYQAVNLPSKAMRWYDQLLEKYPDSPLREEIFAQRVFTADEQEKPQMMREAAQAYLQAYPKGQWRADISILLGIDSLEQQHYVQAVNELSDGLNHTEDTHRQQFVLRNRARAYQESGKRDLALQDLQQVVAHDPLDMAAVIRLGDFLFDQGDFAEAEPLYDKVLASDAPVELKAWAKYRWGLSLDYQGQAGEAQKLLAEVKQLETRAPEFENTIRAAASAVLDEFSLKGRPQGRRVNEGS